MRQVNKGLFGCECSEKQELTHTSWRCPSRFWQLTSDFAQSLALQSLQLELQFPGKGIKYAENTLARVDPTVKTPSLIVT